MRYNTAKDMNGVKGKRRDCVEGVEFHRMEKSGVEVQLGSVSRTQSLSCGAHNQGAWYRMGFLMSGRKDCKLPLFFPLLSVFWQLQLVASHLLSEQGNSPGAEPWALTPWPALLGLGMLPAQAISIACRKPLSFLLRFLHIKWHSFSSVSPQTGLPCT